MSTSPIDLTTVADVKSYAFPTLVSPSADAELQKLITAYSQGFATFIGYPLLSAALAETYNGSGTVSMVLRRVPVTAVGSILLNDKPLTLTTTSAAYGYQVDGDSGVVYMTGGAKFTQGVRNVVVTYTAGYSLPVGCPQDLAQACVEAVADSYQRSQRLGYISKAIAGEVTAYSMAAMPAASKATLKLYQRTGWST